MATVAVAAAVLAVLAWAGRSIDRRTRAAAARLRRLGAPPELVRAALPGGQPVPVVLADEATVWVDAALAGRLADEHQLRQDGTGRWRLADGADAHVAELLAGACQARRARETEHMAAIAAANGHGDGVAARTGRALGRAARRLVAAGHRHGHDHHRVAQAVTVVATAMMLPVFAHHASTGPQAVAAGRALTAAALLVAAGGVSAVLVRTRADRARRDVDRGMRLSVVHGRADRPYLPWLEVGLLALVETVAASSGDTALAAGGLSLFTALVVHEAASRCAVLVDHSGDAAMRAGTLVSNSA